MDSCGDDELGAGEVCLVTEVIDLVAFPTSLHGGDFNGDGHVDLLVDDVVVPGDGNGGFDTTTYTGVTTGFGGAAVGRRDVGTHDHRAASYAFLSLSGTEDLREIVVDTGSGGTAIETPAFPGPLVFGDFDGDGRTDLAYQRDQGDTPSCGLSRIADALGTKTISQVPDGPYGTGDCVPLAADLDADGTDELGLVDTSAGLVIAPMDGAASWTAVDRSPSVDGYADATFGDLDCDGNVEAIVVGPTEAAVIAFALSPDPKAARMEFDGLPGRMLVAVGDLDGDGAPDLVLARGGQLELLRNDGDGGLEPPSSLGTAESPQAMTVLDANGDGKDDLAVALGQQIRLLVSTA